MWTFAYDVSGIDSVTFYYRKDLDGVNPIHETSNEVYRSGELLQSTANVNNITMLCAKPPPPFTLLLDVSKVTEWTAMKMNFRAFPKVTVCTGNCQVSAKLCIVIIFDSVGQCFQSEYRFDL